MKIHFQALILFIIALYSPSITAQFYLTKKKAKNLLTIINWLIPSIFLIVFLGIGNNFFNVQDKPMFSLLFSLAFALIYVPAGIFLLFYWLDKLCSKYFKNSFRILSYIGIAAGLFVFAIILIGHMQRHKIEVRRVNIILDKLPASFDRTKIVQISDLHIGNLYRAEKYLDRIIKIINNEKPNFIMFTGDLVNQKASEGVCFQAFFDSLYPPAKKYGILGNHDYGDYRQWASETEKAENLSQVKQLFADFHFKLLLDTFDIVTNNSGEKIAVIGVENWSKPPFKSYGNLQKALTGIPETDFQILLSHDPTHWDAEVSKYYPQISLTLSGHTHAAQVGIERPIKYSPSSLIFKYWDGLYEKHGQYLFVNRGLGYVGIPLRIGMHPEITIISLQKK